MGRKRNGRWLPRLGFVVSQVLDGKRTSNHTLLQTARL
jgi:hypothetical protein